MRRFLATVSNCAPALTPALLALAMMPLSPNAALSDPSGSDPSTPVTPAAPTCGSDDAGAPQREPSSDSEPACDGVARTAAEVADARAYVIETASPGYTMTLQSAELAIGRLHPEFVVRLANAIREARGAGLPFAGVFSAYRPPAFGVGGFSDKFNSLHTYGLAVDMEGIGRPGSPEAQLWHEIAARNGVVCPYGPHDRAEWNHCQPTSVKMILAQNPLRETVSAAGPFDLDSMFEAGNRMIVPRCADASARFGSKCQRPRADGARRQQPQDEAKRAHCRDAHHRDARCCKNGHRARRHQSCAAGKARRALGRKNSVACHCGRATKIEIRARIDARTHSGASPSCDHSQGNRRQRAARQFKPI
jgi:hypothetical protein